MSYRATNWAYELPITGPSKFVLVVLADMADEADSCYPGQKRIASMTGFSEKTVSRAVSSLEAAGLISREQRHGNYGYRTSDRYQLHLEIKVLPATSEKKPNGQRAYKADSPSLTDSQSIPNGLSGGAVEPPEEPSVEPLGKKTAKRKATATKISKDWTPSPANIAFASSNMLDVKHELGQFRAHAEANDRRQANWDAAFRLWLGNVIKWRKPETKGGGSEWALRR